MPQPLVIVLIVIGSLLALWVLLLIVNLIFVSSFNAIFKKHRKALTVILYTKYENMNRLFSVLNQNGIKYDNRLNALLGDIDVNTFNEPENPEFEKSKNSLAYLKDEIMFVCNQNKELQEDLEFVQVKKNIEEADLMYRNNVTMYNADVLGYNYWINFLPCRFVFKMFKVKRKEIISQHIACEMIFIYISLNRLRRKVYEKRFRHDV